MTPMATVSRPSAAELERGWFDRPAAQVAADLLGARIIHDSADGRVGGRIVEVEAYQGPEDLAAHSSRGPTARTSTMFGPPGFLYVYLIYGMHHCLNVVTGPGTKPEAVLIRALEIDEGLEIARARRGPGIATHRLAAGPGNAGRALGIDRRLDGSDLLTGPVQIEAALRHAPEIRRGPRIGVAYAGAWAAQPLRFWIADDPHVSRR